MLLLYIINVLNCFYIQFRATRILNAELFNKKYERFLLITCKKED